MFDVTVTVLLPGKLEWHQRSQFRPAVITSPLIHPVLCSGCGDSYSSHHNHQDWTRYRNVGALDWLYRWNKFVACNSFSAEEVLPLTFIWTLFCGGGLRTKPFHRRLGCLLVDCTGRLIFHCWSLFFPKWSVSSKIWQLQANFFYEISYQVSKDS